MNSPRRISMATSCGSSTISPGNRVGTVTRRLQGLPPARTSDVCGSTSRRDWMNRRLFLSLLATLPAVRAYADSIGYTQVRQVTATRDGLTFHHRHAWNSPKLSSLFLDLAHHEKFLSTANDFAFVELLDGDRVLFRSPAPALTYLWISPDAQYF